MCQRVTRFAVAAGLTVAALSCLTSVPSKGAEAAIAPQGQGEALRLRSDDFPVPLVVPGDPLKRSITSLELLGTIGGEGEGTGTVSFNENTLTFNEFGDAKIVTAKPGEPCRVAFRQLEVRYKNERRRVYDVAFADGNFLDRMRLVLSDGAGGPHRLIVRSGEAPLRPSSLDPAGIIDLHGIPAVQEPLPDFPRREKINLTTLTSSHSRGDKGLKRLSISGSPAGRVHLQLDPNSLSFNVVGDVTMGTLLGFRPIETTLRRVDVPDPAKQGRLLFEVVAGLPRSYFLVLSPTEAGPHRMLVREGESLRHVLPLHDPNRRLHLKMQTELVAAAPEEQQAIGKLREILGYGFRTKIESDAVSELYVSSGEAAERIDSALSGLMNLRELSFSGSPLGPAGLPALRGLHKLEVVRFRSASISNSGLAPLQDLPRLKHLMFSKCQDITDEGLAHLSGLQNLTHLQLSREDRPTPGQPVADRVTDAGLVHLLGLKKLVHLDLIGQAVTDVGLKRLAGLTSLEQLYLSGDGITDAGLEHLTELSQLQFVYLSDTRATPAGTAVLKSKLPKLNVMGL